MKRWLLNKEQLQLKEQHIHPAAAVPTTIWQGQLAILNKRLQDHNHLKKHLAAFMDHDGKHVASPCVF